MELNQEASAALNFFASPAGVFSEAAVRDAAGFAEIAGHAVRLAAKVATIQGVAQDMEAAMKSRTAIDLACGIVIAQNRCTRSEAMKILTKSSSTRNQKPGPAVPGQRGMRRPLNRLSSSRTTATTNSTGATPRRKPSVSTAKPTMRRTMATATIATTNAFISHTLRPRDGSGAGEVGFPSVRRFPGD